MKLSFVGPLLLLLNGVSSSSVLRGQRNLQDNCGGACTPAFQECGIDENGEERCLCELGARPKIKPNGGALECVDIDQCAESAPCVANSVCSDHDPPEQYKCACKKGFAAIEPVGGTFPGLADASWRPTACVDIDECALETDDCDKTTSTCVNTEGSFTCQCSGGTTATSDGKCIVEVVEVAAPELKCSLANATGFCNGDYQVCGLDTNGDIGCLCLDGFSQMRANSTCTDNNECANSETNNCDLNNGGYCVNIPGTFICECRDGFTGQKSCTKQTNPPTPAPVAEPVEESGPVPATVVTPGAPRPVFIKTGCTRIQDIQGDGDAHVYVGQSGDQQVTICDATVTYIGHYGFFVQDNADGSERSSGMYISFGGIRADFNCLPEDLNAAVPAAGTGANNAARRKLGSPQEPSEPQGPTCSNPLGAPKVNQRLDITGYVNEFGGLTGIIDSYWKPAAPTSLPTGILGYQKIQLPVSSISELERYEGMRVEFIPPVAESGKSLIINGVEDFPNQVTVCAAEGRLFEYVVSEEGGDFLLPRSTDDVPLSCIEIRNLVDSSPFTHKLGGVKAITTDLDPPLRAGNKMTRMRGILFDVFDVNEGLRLNPKFPFNERKLDAATGASAKNRKQSERELGPSCEQDFLPFSYRTWVSCRSTKGGGNGFCKKNPLGPYAGPRGDTGSSIGMYMLAPIVEADVAFSGDNPRPDIPTLVSDVRDPAFSLITSLNLEALNNVFYEGNIMSGTVPFIQGDSSTGKLPGPIIGENPEPKIFATLAAFDSSIYAVRDAANIPATVSYMNGCGFASGGANCLTRRLDAQSGRNYVSVSYDSKMVNQPKVDPKLGVSGGGEGRCPPRTDIIYDENEHNLVSVSYLRDVLEVACLDASDIEDYKSCQHRTIHIIEDTLQFYGFDEPLAATFQNKHNSKKLFTVVTADFSGDIFFGGFGRKLFSPGNIDDFQQIFIYWAEYLSSNGVEVSDIIFAGDIGPFLSESFNDQYYTRSGLTHSFFWGSTEMSFSIKNEGDSSNSAIWHINSDEVGSFGFSFQDTRGPKTYAPRSGDIFNDSPMRFSDHDPIFYGRIFPNVGSGEVAQCNSNAACQQIIDGGSSTAGNVCKLFEGGTNLGVCGSCVRASECDEPAVGGAGKDETRGCVKAQSSNDSSGVCGDCSKDFHCREGQVCKEDSTCGSPPLELGDIAFTCWQQVGSVSGFSFLTMADIDSGTEIFFSDVGYTSAGDEQLDGNSIHSDDFEIKFTAPEFIGKGTVTLISGDESSAGTLLQSFAVFERGTIIRWSGNMQGDQIFAYTKMADNSKVFLGALDHTTNGWDSAGDSNNGDSASTRSFIPSGLEVFNKLYAPVAYSPASGEESKNGRINMGMLDTSDTKTEIWKEMGDSAKWIMGNPSEGAVTCPDGSLFTIESGPELCSESECDFRCNLNGFGDDDDDDGNHHGHHHLITGPCDTQYCEPCDDVAP